MKKLSLLILPVMMLAFAAGTIGCDNRSQMEKDLDKAASQAESAAKDAQKNLGL